MTLFTAHGTPKIYYNILTRAGTTTSTDAQWQAIRNAQITKISANSPSMYGLSNLDLTQVDIHYNQASYTTIGLRFAKLLLYRNFATGTNPIGPSLAYTKVDASHINITLTHVAGTDFTPTSAINNFIVTDDGTPVTISTATRINATTISLALASPLAGTEVVYHDYGKLSSASNLVDNSTGAYPAQSLYGGIVGKAVIRKKNKSQGFRFSFGFDF
jgi:hypothetical protein